MRFIRALSRGADILSAMGLSAEKMSAPRRSLHLLRPLAIAMALQECLASFARLLLIANRLPQRNQMGKRLGVCLRHVAVNDIHVQKGEQRIFRLLRLFVAIPQ